MTPELENKLIEKYPKLFGRKDLSMQETCMCFGIETNDGWYMLLDSLFATIQSYINCNKKSQVELEQIKEKFGCLRVYSYGGNDLIDGMIWFAENLSYHICEECGSMENVSQTKGWIVTLCEKCHRKRKIRRFFYDIRYKISSFFRKVFSFGRKNS